MWKKVQSFVFEKERAISRNGLVLDGVCVSKRQGTRRTYDAVTDEAWEEVRYNNRHLLRLLSAAAMKEVAHMYI